MQGEITVNQLYICVCLCSYILIILTLEITILSASGFVLHHYESLQSAYCMNVWALQISQCKFKIHRKLFITVIQCLYLCKYAVQPDHVTKCWSTSCDFIIQIPGLR
jgi:hypothetical protein